MNRQLLHTKFRLQVYACVLLLVVQLPAFMRLGVLVDYYIHRDQISAAFCVNTDKANLDCKGRCHLAKVLEAGEPEAQIPGIPVETFMAEAIPESAVELAGVQTLPIVHRAYPCNAVPQQPVHATVFNPPRA
jgi:hypothetical protein